MTPGAWTAVAIVGVVLLVTGLILNADMSVGERIYLNVRVTPYMIIGAVLVLIGVPMAWRASVRRKRSASELPPPPPPSPRKDS